MTEPVVFSEYDNQRYEDVSAISITYPLLRGYDYSPVNSPLHSYHHTSQQYNMSNSFEEIEIINEVVSDTSQSIDDTSHSIDDTSPSIDEYNDEHLPAVLEDMEIETTFSQNLMSLSTEELTRILQPTANFEYDEDEEFKDLYDSYLPQDNQPPQYHREAYDDSDRGYSTETSSSTPERVSSPTYLNPDLLPCPVNGTFGIYHRHSESSSGDEGYDGGDDESVPPQRRGRRGGRGKGKGKLLWQFMVDLVNDPMHRSIIDWVDHEAGVFRIIQSAKVATLWGKEKNNSDMTYEKMSRALRFLRKMGFFDELPKPYCKRLHFRFGARVGQHFHKKTGITTTV